MGIKSLTQSIKRECPNGIKHENLSTLSGKRVAVDASLIIYQQLLSHNLLKNKKGKITNHITGLFYKLVNYLSHNIELVFVFDGRPPALKQECIKERRKKVYDAKEKMEACENIEEKNDLEKSTVRMTWEMVDDVKRLLSYLGISYVHMEVGEGEAIAAELCRIGYVDYVLTEDMDTLVGGCPKLIRSCTDKAVKRKDIVSILYHDEILKGLGLTEEQFIKYRRDLREKGTSSHILDGEDLRRLPPEEKWSARYFLLDEVFGSAIIDEQNVVDLPWYYNIGSWKGLRSFLGSDKILERPSRDMLSGKGLSKLGDFNDEE